MFIIFITDRVYIYIEYLVILYLNKYAIYCALGEKTNTILDYLYHIL